MVRNNDAITTAGDRVRPGPIEGCLIQHPAVRIVAVIGAHEHSRIVEFMDALPMTTTGRIARKRLREPHAGRSEAWSEAWRGRPSA